MNRRLTGILASVFQLRQSEIRPELTKADVGTWDSLKQMDLVLSLESEYDISLVIPDIIRMVSVANIIEVLKEKGVDLAD
ncbi:acyl carrier protein [Cupriavidus basilensis OR16]|uniref:Acyl carrier protein n=1 Tax=Cupriavidus basilensis OR16 TaxID=1127483 RepID=H1SAF3_9BURK|nr:acyl carrier protein [Cupriavidus basilensis]EHP40426.1 acyl carrier protein [Cupriavidus basilensis OR16]